jgi:hypothetical protein
MARPFVAAGAPPFRNHLDSFYSTTDSLADPIRFLGHLDGHRPKRDRRNLQCGPFAIGQRRGEEMIIRNRMHGLTLGLATVLLAAGTAAARPDPGWVEHVNPLLGYRLEIPDDWDEAFSDVGIPMLGLDAGVSTTLDRDQPLLWFFASRRPPEETAAALAIDLRAGLCADVGCRRIGRGVWEVAGVVRHGVSRPLLSRYRVVGVGRGSYLLLAMVRTDRAAATRAEVERVLGSLRPVRLVRAKELQEPREHAYRMLLPSGWTWTGRIIRTRAIPGFFEWRVQSADGTSGAFTGAPGVFDITRPYQPAATAAKTIVLPALARQIPGLRLESVRALPRPSGYFTGKLRLVTGPTARVDKARADLVAVVNGRKLRMRITVATVMTSASALVGGRGNWTLYTSGAWAPDDGFERLYPLARAVLSSHSTDPEWKRRQGMAVSEAALFAAKQRDEVWKKIADYVGFPWPGGDGGDGGDPGGDDPGGDDPGGDDPGGDDPGGDDGDG